MQGQSVYDAAIMQLFVSYGVPTGALQRDMRRTKFLKFLLKVDFYASSFIFAAWQSRVPKKAASGIAFSTAIRRRLHVRLPPK
jgi:hypothetical protein